MRTFSWFPLTNRTGGLRSRDKTSSHARYSELGHTPLLPTGMVLSIITQSNYAQSEKWAWWWLPFTVCSALFRLVILTQQSVQHLWSNLAEPHSDGSDEETEFQRVKTRSIGRKKKTWINGFHLYLLTLALFLSKSWSSIVHGLFCCLGCSCLGFAVILKWPTRSSKWATLEHTEKPKDQ